MEADSKSPPKQHTRKRSVPEQHEPRAKRRAGNVAAAASDNTAVAVSMHYPPRQLDDGPLFGHDGIASSSASDGPCSAVGSTPAITGAMVHVCGHCQKRFRSPGKLAQHARVHTTGDNAAFYCSFCPKQFGKQWEATRHERTHTGEKPYACSMCPRRFSNKSHVAPHERTHTSEKPYACSICPIRFSRKGAVAPHERTHTGEKPYACSMCPRHFTQKSDVARHERTPK